MTINRGDVFWVNLDPTIGSEIKKTRPCVVVSNDVANRFSPLVTVLPITTQRLEKVFPHEVALGSTEKLKNSKVKVNQIRTVDKRRLRKHLITLPRPVMEKIDSALALHLGLI